MDILYVITALGVGGAEQLLVDVCKQLKNDNRITVAYLYDLTDLKYRLVDMGIDVVFLDLRRNGFLKTVMSIKKIVKVKGIDVVHTHLPAADTVGRLAGLLSKRVKVLSTIHCCDDWKESNRLQYRLLRLYNRITVNWFKRVKLIAVGKAVSDFCIQKESIKPNKITVIYNFIDYEAEGKTNKDFAFPFSREKYILIIAARLEAQKEHKLLFQAVKNIVARGEIPNLLLIVLGDGSLKGELEALADDNIKLLGIKKNIYDYLRCSNLFVLPSHTEGFGLATIEAFYCKTPVLASDIAPNRETLADGERGVLFKSGSLEDLEKKIIAIYNGEYDFNSMSKKASEFVKSHNVNDYIKQMLAVIKG